MLTDIWTGFIKTHLHLSVQDLEDIQKLLELAEDTGYLKGLERGQDIMVKNQEKILNLFK